MYFSALRDVYESTQIGVKCVPVGGVALTVAEKAVAVASEYAKGRGRDSFAEKDRVWAVFDVDDHPRLEEAVSMCEECGVGVGLSNPCFELWLILHVEEHDQQASCKEMKEHWKSLRKEFSGPGGAATLNCQELGKRVMKAEERATELQKRREAQGDPRGNPSTSVGALTTAIREADVSARR